MAKHRSRLFALLVLVWLPTLPAGAGDASLNYASERADSLPAATSAPQTTTKPDTPANPTPNSEQSSITSRLIEVPSVAAPQSLALYQWVFPADIASQRNLYQQARAALQSKRYGDYQRLREQLRGYPLEDYLEYKYLAQNIELSTFAQIAKFREAYGNDRTARRLRNAKLLSLARAGNWQPFLQQYDQATSNQRLRCHYARGLYQLGDQQQALELARELWLTPTSMPDECDPIFHIFTGAESNIEQLAWQRFVAAYQKSEFTLANYLRRFMHDAHAQQAQQLLDVYSDSANIAKQWRSAHTLLSKAIVNEEDRRGIQILWVKRLARHDIDDAVKLVTKKLKRPEQTGLQADQHQLFLDQIKPFLLTRYALSDYNRLPIVYKKLGQPRDEKSLQWLLRAHIAKGQWRKLATLCDNLPEELRKSERWTYWSLRARQLAGTINAEQLQALTALADNANFYAFAAARHTGQNFKLRPQTYSFDSVDMRALVDNINIKRGLEHRVYGDFDAANIAWVTGLRALDQTQLIHAAYLASSIGWHQQAILTAARAEAWQHYGIRFPKVKADEFEQQGLRYNQPPEWFYATARQESALASNIQSPAGAIGLMQLMPSTAKQVARSLNRSYQKAQLYQPDYSIVLGSRYLAELYQRFGNRALSSAAYNAGPHRVEAWLKNLKHTLPLDAWIETIRFSETRQYVQNVMSFGLIHQALHSAGYPSIETQLGVSSVLDNATQTGQNIAAAVIEPSLSPATLTSARPWPSFSFIGDVEDRVQPYKQQIAAASKRPL